MNTNNQIPRTTTERNYQAEKTIIQRGKLKNQQKENSTTKPSQYIL